jgi:DNA-binding NtrC family response regulator
MNSNRVLVASPNIDSRRVLVEILNHEGLSTIGVTRVRDCQNVLSTQAIRLIFCESRLSDGCYRDVLALARSTKHKVRVVVTSRLADWHEYGEAMREGAFDLVISPCGPADVLKVLTLIRREEFVDTLASTAQQNAASIAAA